MRRETCKVSGDSVEERWRYGCAKLRELPLSWVAQVTQRGVDCETGTTPGGPSFGTYVDGGGMVCLSELRAERTSVRRWVGVDECSGSERRRAHNPLELEVAHCNTQADLGLSASTTEQVY